MQIGFVNSKMENLFIILGKRKIGLSGQFRAEKLRNFLAEFAAAAVTGAVHGKYPLRHFGRDQIVCSIHRRRRTGDIDKSDGHQRRHPDPRGKESRIEIPHCLIGFPVQSVVKLGPACLTAEFPAAVVAKRRDGSHDAGDVFIQAAQHERRPPALTVPCRRKMSAIVFR